MHGTVTVILQDVTSCEIVCKLSTHSPLLPDYTKAVKPLTHSLSSPLLPDYAKRATHSLTLLSPPPRLYQGCEASASDQGRLRAPPPSPHGHRPGRDGRLQEGGGRVAAEGTTHLLPTARDSQWAGAGTP